MVFFYLDLENGKWRFFRNFYIDFFQFSFLLRDYSVNNVRDFYKNVILFFTFSVFFFTLFSASIHIFSISVFDHNFGS